MRTTAASPPGRCTVSAMTMWSYCSQIQRLLARSGEPSSRSRASACGTTASRSLAGIGTRLGVGSNGRS